MTQEVISTNLKRYEQLDANTFKVLVSYFFSGSALEKSNLGEKSFIPAIEKMFDGEVSVVAGTLVDYNAIPGNYKTCIVKAAIRAIPVSTASLSSIIDQRGFSTLSKNIFVDPATNAIWKKVVSESGVAQLIQTTSENMEEMMRQCLDVSEVVASARPLYALSSGKFDYALFYNPSSQKVESGIALESNGVSTSIVSRRDRKINTVNSHYLITVASVSELINQFEKDLKGAKGSLDVMEAYISFWFNSLEGKEASNYIESELKRNVLKSTASVSDDVELNEFLEEVNDSVEDNEKAKDSNLVPSKEEIEAILSTKFDSDKMSSFAYVDQEGKDQYTIKFTKPISIDDISYILTAIKEVFKINPTMQTNSEFVNIALNFAK